MNGEAMSKIRRRRRSSDARSKLSAGDLFDLPPTVRSVLGSAAPAYYLPEYIKWKCGSDGGDGGDGVELPQDLQDAYRRLGTSVTSDASSEDDTTFSRSIDVETNNHDDRDKAALYESIARIIVAPCTDQSRSNKATIRSRRCIESLEDIVDGCIRVLVRSGANYRRTRKKDDPDHDGSYGRNVLSMGYVSAREGEKGTFPNMALGMHCVQPNATASYARTSELTRAIHRLVGDDIMSEMLTMCIVLIPAGTVDGVVYGPANGKSPTRRVIPGTMRRGNYFQLCGPPLTYYKPRMSDADTVEAGNANVVYDDGNDGGVVTREGRKRTRNDSIDSGEEDFRQSKVARGNRPEEELDDQCPTDAKQSIPNPYASSSSSLKAAATDREEATLYDESSINTDGDGEANNREGTWEPNAPLPRHRMFYSESFVKKAGLPPSHILNLKDDGKEYGGVLERLLDSMVRLRKPSNGTGSKKKKKKKRSTKRRKRWKRLRISGIQMCRELRKRHNQCDYARLLERNCPLPDFCSKGRGSGDGTPTTLSELSASYVSGDEVASFVSSCLWQAFPGSFWGSRHNLDAVCSTIRTFINLRRREQLPEKEIMKGIRVTDIEWLFGRKSSSTSKIILTRTDYEAGTRLVQNILRWLYCSYIIPLIRSCFYATETEFTAKRVVFYRKPIWTQFRSLALRRLKDKQYAEIEFPEAARRRSGQLMGCSKLRLLPKKTGVRALNMLSHVQRVTFDKNSGKGHGPDSTIIPRPKLPHPAPTDRHLSTNTILGRAFDVLKHEHNQAPATFGCGVFGFNQVFPRLLGFSKDLKAHREKTGASQEQDLPLYFASVDLHRCYDNIDQTYLFDLVQRVLKSKEYLLTTHHVLHPFQSLDMIQRKRSTHLCCPEDIKNFTDLAGKDLAEKYSHSIFIDGTNTMARKGDLLELLKEHIFSNLVVINGDFGPRFLSQASGIPQGSVLSTMLCNYYYGDLESRLLGDLFEPTNKASVDESMPKRHIDLLVRIVDDFLLISTDKCRCTRFLEKMRIGIPSLGVNINQAKTRINFDCVPIDAINARPLDKTVETSSGETFFPWCGILLNTKTCETRIDYKRFADTLAVDGLTVDRLGAEGSKMLLRIKSFVRPRCQPILFDLRLHTVENGLLNFYQVMLLGAIKTVGYIRTALDDGAQSNHCFIVQCINDVIFYAQALIGGRLRAAPSRHEYPSQNDITIHHLSKEAAHWLGRHAFRAVLKTLDETQGFGEVVRCLSEGEEPWPQEKHAGNRLDHAMLCKVANKALKEFDLRRFEF